MRSKFIVITFIVSLFTAFKKDYTCVCGYGPPLTGAPVFQIHDTNKNAEQKCIDYLENHNFIPEYSCGIK